MADKKISEFLTAASLQSGDYLNIVRSSVNYKVDTAQLAPFLGAVGTIQPVGSGTAIPVLEQPTATSNNIRGIESGSGILASISALNGITIKHNFTVDKTGAALIVDETVASPVFRSLVAGSGIAIATSGNTIRVSTSVVGASNTVIVNQESDFPAPSAGVITLTDNTNYIIGASFSTANRLQLGQNNSITGNNTFAPTLTYTGSGTMFTGSGVNFDMRNLHLNCASGEVLSLTGGITNIDTVRVANSAKFATLTSMTGFSLRNVSCSNTTTGITVAGTGWVVLSLDKLAMISTSASYIGVDLGSSVHSSLEMNDLICIAPAGAIGIKGLPNGGNLQSGRLGTVTGGEFSGGLTPLDTITSSDIRWNFSGNSGIADTITDALLGFDGNATETVISVASTPVKVAATWVLQDARKFTTDTTGKATYIGERSIHLPVDIAIGVIASGGGAKDVKIYIALNGSVISATGRTVQTSGSVPRTISIPWQLTLTTNDYLEVYISNESDTTNIIVQHAVMRVN